jgi:hypothetical protein
LSNTQIQQAQTDNDNDKDKEKHKVSKNNQENLTFIDDPNPGIPSIEKEYAVELKPLSEEERSIWTENIKSTHEALIKKYSYARVCEIHVKQGYDESAEMDIWITKKYKYHALTIGEKHELNDMNASIADIERDSYKRLDVIQNIIATIKDASKLRQKIQDALRDQQAADTSNPSYHDLVDRRIEYQEKAMWLYFRCPAEIYRTSSVSDIALALDVSQFIESNPHPLRTGAGIS